MSTPKKPNRPTTTWGPLSYSSNHPMTLAIRPDADVDEVSTFLNNRLSMLEAMLLLTYGDNPVSNLCDSSRDSFMWACSEMASECRGVYDELLSAGAFEPKRGDL